MPQWALSFQIEIWNLDRTKSSFLATSLYKKVIFTKNWVTRSCRPSDDIALWCFLKILNKMPQCFVTCYNHNLLWYITAHVYHLPWQRLAWLLRVTYMCKSFNATKNLNERILASLNIGRVVMKIVDVTVSTQCPQGGVPVYMDHNLHQKLSLYSGKLEFFHSNFLLHWAHGYHANFVM